MIDHEFTRPVIFAGGRSLQHVCRGRAQPRNDIWETYHGPERGEAVSMVFCWSCLTLFVHEDSRGAYLAWVGRDWGWSAWRQRQDTFLKLADLTRARPDAQTERLEKVDAGAPEPTTIERAVPTRGFIVVDDDALTPDHQTTLEAMGWTVITKKPGRSVSVVPVS